MIDKYINTDILQHLQAQTDEKTFYNLIKVTRDIYDLYKNNQIYFDNVIIRERLKKLDLDELWPIVSSSRGTEREDFFKDIGILIKRVVNIAGSHEWVAWSFKQHTCTSEAYNNSNKIEHIMMYLLETKYSTKTMLNVLLELREKSCSYKTLKVHTIPLYILYKPWKVKLFLQISQVSPVQIWFAVHHICRVSILCSPEVFELLIKYMFMKHLYLSWDYACHRIASSLIEYNKADMLACLFNVARHYKIQYPNTLTFFANMAIEHDSHNAIEIINNECAFRQGTSQEKYIIIFPQTLHTIVKSGRIKCLPYIVKNMLKSNINMQSYINNIEQGIHDSAINYDLSDFNILFEYLTSANRTRLTDTINSQGFGWRKQLSLS